MFLVGGVLANPSLAVRFAALLVLAAVIGMPQQPDMALDLGKAAFRSNCAFCHGLEGRGGRGPNLVASQLARDGSDDAIRNVIINGVPGSTMPAFSSFEKDDLDHLVLFLRHLAGGSSGNETVGGDPAKGKAVYQRSGCAACHRTGLEGSAYGPDLTRIGAARSIAYIRESILDPSADVPEEYEGVTVVTKDGKRLTGIRVNEDTFTIQLRDPSQAFRMYFKDEVQEVIHEKKSLMPAYRSFSEDDLQNLLAYLHSLRGRTQAGGPAKKAEGIR